VTESEHRGGAAPYRSRKVVDWSRPLTLATSAVAGVLAVAVVFFLTNDALPVFKHSGLGYITGARWFFRAGEFGALPMIYGSIVVSIVALVLAVPIGLGAAVFSAEFCSERTRRRLKVAVELLAGVPSVVYGLLGVLLLRNWIYRLLQPWDPLSGDTLLTAGVLLAVMVLPTVVTLADDALHAVPDSARQAARSLGLTASETLFSVSLPIAKPGVVAAVLLAFGRALGETIAVFLVVGRRDNVLPETIASLRPLAGAGQTLTSKLGGSETFLAYGDPLHWGAIVGLAVILLVLATSVALASAFVRGARSA